MYQLMSYGIPVDLIPVDSDGKTKTNNHKKWIIKQRVKEMECPDGSLNWDKIDMPTHRDVLVGRGKPLQSFPGTVFMRHLIGQNSTKYTEATSNLDKLKVRLDIIETIQESGGRFLRRDDKCPGWWVEASDKEVHDKIQKAFSAQGATRRPGYRNSQRVRTASPPSSPELPRKKFRMGVDPDEYHSESSCCKWP